MLVQRRGQRGDSGLLATGELDGSCYCSRAQPRLAERNIHVGPKGVTNHLPGHCRLHAT